MIKHLNITHRYQWSALNPKYGYYYHIPKVITIHDSYRLFKQHNKKFIKLFKGCKTVKEIQKLHMEKYGLIDIGYHFIIDITGEIFEGRPIETIGNVPNVLNQKIKSDDGNIHIMFVGNFDVESPSRQQVRALLNLLEYINREYNYMNIPDCVTFRNIGTDKNKLITLIKYIKLKSKEVNK